MQLNHLTDQQLLQDTKTSASKERAATLVVIEHIQEVHRRKLFADLGYPSLFKYLVYELKYSEGQAYRRIQAAKLVTNVPEVKNKIASGSLNLTNASKLQGFFSEIKLELGQKLALVEQVERRTTRECENIIAQIKQPGTSTSFNLCLKLNDTQKTQWDKLSGLLAHQKLNKEALLAKIMEIALKELDPSKPKRHYQKKKTVLVSKENGHEFQSQSQTSRGIPAQIKRDLYQRAQSSCEWIDFKGKRCHSNHALQIDHIYPFALGGEASLQNLQLLCRNHHQRKTIKEWGIRKT